MDALKIVHASVTYPDNPEEDHPIPFPVSWELLDQWELKFYCQNCGTQNTISGNQLTFRKQKVRN